MGSGRHTARRFILSRSGYQACGMMATAVIVLGMAAAVSTAVTQPRAPAPAVEEEYGEFLARPKELAVIPVNDIVKSIRLNGGAMTLGRKVYDKACAACHGAD